jgi:microcompartment protein CcmL/EutN
MSRTADYTIQGFIYQFNITLQKLLEVGDANCEIIVEGEIEDIDIFTSKGIEAIQCKYHESKEKYTLSAIYKPVLQMMCHYKKYTSKNIKYRLYAHFPNETVGNKISLSTTDIAAILATEAKTLKTLKEELNGFSDVIGFIENFEMEYGASLDDAQKTVTVALVNEGFSKADVEDIFYPNAIHHIAELSTKHNATERKIKKAQFIQVLKEKKKTAISRWTKELQSFEKLLKKRREQIRDRFSNNSSNRAIILDSDYIIDFNSKIVQFIEEFVNKYNRKIILHHCPLFSLICTKEALNDIWRRLNTKKIIVERGLIADQFDITHFLRKPIKAIKDGKIEFKVRLCSHDTDFKEVLSKTNFDDIFIISDKTFDFATITNDTNIEKIETRQINELKYLLLLNNTL